MIKRKLYLAPGLEIIVDDRITTPVSVTVGDDKWVCWQMRQCEWVVGTGSVVPSITRNDTCPVCGKRGPCEVSCSRFETRHSGPCGQPYADGQADLCDACIAAKDAQDAEKETK